MHYRKITLIATALLVLLGVLGIKYMPKQEFPPFTIRQGVVVAVYPGATSAQVEEQVAKPLERYLFTFNEIKKQKTYSMSQDGIVYVMVELNDNIKNKDEVWSKIKHGLNGFKAQLPSGVLALVAKDDFGDTSALLISVESKDKTYRELDTYAEQLEDKLRRIESVSNLRRYGVQKEEISVYLDKDKMAVYGIDTRWLLANLFSQGLTTVSGEIENADVNMPIHFESPLSTEKEIADQIIRQDPNGQVIRVKDIARIEREYNLDNSYVKNNGTKSIILSLEMREGNNIVAYGNEVDEVLASFEQQIPESVSIKRIADQPKVVEESVTSFLRDLVISIVVVILVMMVLFPFRSAVVAATSIPISIFISIGIMYVCRIPLNTVTLAALIVVLGMIVDNAIIVVDAYLERLDKGMSRWHAAISSAKDYFGSIFLATLCISIIFFPLLFTMTGQFRDFLEFFPWTIFISLMVSLLVAMVIIPIFEFWLIKKGLQGGKEGKEKKFNLLDHVQSGYNRVLDFTFKYPKLTIAGGALSIGIAVVIMMNLNRRMMPIADRDQFAVEIYLPQGASLERTASVADSMYTILSGDERVKSVTSFIGMASPRFQTTYAPNMPSKHYAQFIVNTESIEATKQLLNEYTDIYANYFPNAYVKFKELDYQSVQSPIEVRFMGENIDELKQAADSLMEAMREMDELVWVHTNYEELLPAVQVQIDPIQAARLGITKMMASAEVAVHTNGLTAGTIWEGDYPLQVKLKTDHATEQASQLGDRYISTAVPGVMVPLRQIADVTPHWQEGQIVRRNGVRTVSVMANVRRNENENNAFKKVIEIANTQIAPQLPDGVEMEFGGTVENDKEIITPIASGLLVAICIIFIFLVLNFKKLSIAATALGSISLCSLGAVIGLWMFDVNFGLTCVLGVISLLGIIVRNAIIMFEHAEDLHRNKRCSARDAAYDAGSRRMLPIFLTSATTAVGVIPMIISNSSLWSPMGIVICSGTILSMVMAVTILPVLYWKIYGDEPSKTKQSK